MLRRLRHRLGIILQSFGRECPCWECNEWEPDYDEGESLIDHVDKIPLEDGSVLNIPQIKALSAWDISVKETYGYAERED